MQARLGGGRGPGREDEKAWEEHYIRTTNIHVHVASHQRQPGSIITHFPQAVRHGDFLSCSRLRSFKKGLFSGMKLSPRPRNHEPATTSQSPLRTCGCHVRDARGKLLNSIVHLSSQATTTSRAGGVKWGLVRIGHCRSSCSLDVRHLISHKRHNTTAAVLSFLRESLPTFQPSQRMCKT